MAARAGAAKEKMMQEALFIENAFWQSEATKDIRRRLAGSAQAQGLDLHLCTNADFLKADSFDHLPPAVLFWDKDVRLAETLERCGLRLFNPARAIRLCDDKTLTHLALSDSGIAMPETLLCPASFQSAGYPSLGFLRDAGERLGYPFVIKEGFGSFGQQVYLAQDLREAEAIVAPRAGTPLLFQRFVSESAGQDLRLYVVKGEVIGAMRRVSDRGDFRANIGAGGHGEAWQPDREQENMALAACQALGLDFAGVDLLLSREGPLLCEVNSNAHFQALQALTGCDPADAIIRMIREYLP
ncbi:MAG: RimK family alpha-L-glutamate ligase [Christensenellales bacterium]